MQPNKLKTYTHSKMYSYAVLCRQTSEETCVVVNMALLLRAQMSS